MSTAPPASFHDLTFPSLERELTCSGVKPIHAAAFWRELYCEATLNPDRLSPPLQKWLAGQTRTTRLPEVEADIPSSDGLTRKVLLRLHDGQTIETVRMGYANRLTACLSTQAGCAMGCTFCATGQMGFSRHLTPGEIIGQVLHHQHALRASPCAMPTVSGLRNLVLMGMGEPLHNYDNVMAALEIATDRRGLNLGPGRITISTVGLVPGIRRMAEERRPYNLAVSLHGATDEARSALVPIGHRWPLAELIDACRFYNETTGRGIFFAWTLIAGQNDSPKQARQLASLLTGLNGHVNLIPLNPTDGFAGAAARPEAAATFQRILQDAGLPSTLRQYRGIDVAAGCGQLRAERQKRAAG